MSATGRTPGKGTLIRDAASYLIGVALLAKQAGIVLDPPATPNDTLIWIGALLIGAPGVVQVVSGRFGNASTTAQQQSSSAAQALQPSPSPSAGNGAGRQLSGEDGQQ